MHKVLESGSAVTVRGNRKRTPKALFEVQLWARVCVLLLGSVGLSRALAVRRTLSWRSAQPRVNG